MESRQKRLSSDQQFRLFEIRVTIRQLLEENYEITRDPATLDRIAKARELAEEILNTILGEGLKTRLN